jgi:nucleoside-diphosphate-sugar epimerase
VIVHAAGALRGSASTLVRSNAIATRLLVRAATRHRIRRFVLVSSLAVYGTARLRPGDVLDESCPVGSASGRPPYAYSKIAQEQVCWDAYRADRLPLVVLRPGVIFGPGRSCLTDRVGPRVGRWVALIGPSRPLPYTFVRNCARAVALAATASTPLEGDAFNIVDDELPTGREIIRRYRRAGTAMHVLPVPARCAPLLSRMFEPWQRWSDGMLPAAFVPDVVDTMYKPLRFSNERAKHRLGWTPSVDLETAFALTFAGTS